MTAKGWTPKLLAAIEPFCIGYHGVQRAGIKKGDKVLVVGAGTIGVLAGCAAKALGGEVYMCDVAEKKLRYAMDTFEFDGMILNDSPEALEKAVGRSPDRSIFAAQKIIMALTCVSRRWDCRPHSRIVLMQQLSAGK